MANVKQKSVKVEREEINIQTTKGMDLLNQHRTNGTLRNYYEMCDLVVFLKTLEKSPLRSGNYHIYTGTDDNLFVIKDRAIYGTESEAFELNKYAIDRMDIKSDYPSGILITDVQSTSVNEDFSSFVLINADEPNSGGPDVPLIDTLQGYEMPLVSFQCLAQFWNEKKMVTMLSDGQLQLLDYTSEEKVPLKAHEKKALASKNGHNLLKAPLGFTLMKSAPHGNHWHRSGTCLFHETKKNEYYLLGQDEGTYFGVQLPWAADSIEDAFEVLTPDVVRGKKGIERQGEWFFLPVKESEVPETKDCLVQFCTHGTCGDEAVHLPLDNANSNRHYVVTIDGRVSKDGKLYALDPSLDHDQHSAVSAMGWHTFVRNTALRAVSQEGVD